MKSTSRNANSKNKKNPLQPFFDNFPLFVGLVWQYIGLPKPTPIQIDIAKTLQDPPSNRFILEGFRGVAKSFITCAYVVWSLWRDPQLKILIVSANKERADANATFVKKIINVLPFLEHLKAREGQRDTQNLFDVGLARPDHSPSVKSVGIEGQLTGSRADIIIADDVEVVKNSFTQVLRDRLFELVREFDAVLKPTGEAKIIYLGTPQNEMSLYNELQERGYQCRIYPARYPYDYKQRSNYGERLAPFISNAYDADSEHLAGKPTDPLRFDEEDLLKRELSYGKSGFLLQFMLDTSLSDIEKYPLKLKDLLVGNYSPIEAPLKVSWCPSTSLIVNEPTVPILGLKNDFLYFMHSASEEMKEYGYKILSIDPSGRGTDETGYSVLYWLNGFIYLMEVGGMKGGYSDDTLSRLAQVAKKWKVNDVVIEANFGDGMYTKLFEPVLKKVYGGCGCTEVKSKGQKEQRIIDTLEPVLSNHKLAVTIDCLRKDATLCNEDYKYSCFYQMTRITRDRGSLVHDDRLDSLAQGVAYLIDFMGIDADTGINDITEEWLEDHLDSFYGFVTENIGGTLYTRDMKEKNNFRGSTYFSRQKTGYKLKYTS